jgi:hypothetical protein
VRHLLRLTGLIVRRKRTTTAEGQELEHAPRNELGQFIEVINRVNDESDKEYVTALAQLRAAKDAVLKEAQAILTRGTNTSFAVRHSTLLAVAALRDGSALDLLSEVALNPQPLPPDPPPDIKALHGHGSQERVEYDMLALDALDGIVGLADDGHAPALDVLFQAATTGSLTVRTTAMAALAARTDRGEMLERAQAALPPELRHLGLTRFASVRDVPQVRDPRLHLAQPERGVPAAPTLLGDQDTRSRPEQRRASNAPRISKEDSNA